MEGVFINLESKNTLHQHLWCTHFVQGQNEAPPAFVNIGLVLIIHRCKPSQLCADFCGKELRYKKEKGIEVMLQGCHHEISIAYRCQPDNSKIKGLGIPND